MLVDVLMLIVAYAYAFAATLYAIDTLLTPYHAAATPHAMRLARAGAPCLRAAPRERVRAMITGARRYGSEIQRDHRHRYR